MIYYIYYYDIDIKKLKFILQFNRYQYVIKLLKNVIKKIAGSSRFVDWPGELARNVIVCRK